MGRRTMANASDHVTPRSPAGPQPGPTKRRSWIPRWLFSMKFAIWIALLLAVTSVAGVLVQQFFPMRNEQEAAQLAERLPAPAFRAFVFLGLQDPFRAVWFRVLLGLLAASLIVCSSKRVRSAFKQALHLHPVREPRSLVLLHNSATVHHASPQLFDAIVTRLRRRLYVGRVERSEGEFVAALHQGGISRTGPVLLHLGILALVFGGLLSSLLGRRFFVEQSPGETATLAGSDLQLRVDDFRIERNDRDEIKQYRSRLVLLNGDREVLGLLGRNPFPDSPPKAIRAALYRYEFTAPGDGSGAWWKRTYVREYLPEVSLESPSLRAFLSAHGWLD